MEIKFAEYTLTTEHPLSSYGLGVLVGPDGRQYMPPDVLPSTANKFFDLPPMLAGEFIVAWASKRSGILPDNEIDLIRRYLAQDPQGRFALPELLELRKNQCKYQLSLEMGDVSQGVHNCYWELGDARVSVMLYEITEGKLVWENGEVKEA